MEQKTIREFIKTIKTQDTGPSPYDTTAEVIRIEDGIAWVHIPGGVDETPAAMTINAKEGDTVRVRVAAGRAWITGSDTAPPTDDHTANAANSNASEAKRIANKAIDDAMVASTAAASARDSADNAAISANEAQESATIANESAIQAIADAEAAQEAAETAGQEAAVAHTAAVNAQNSANQALLNAESATQSANSALTQLSTVEEVVGTLQWISEHGSYALTTDTEVIPGKTYFTRISQSGGYSYAVVTNPESDPSAAGYYELTGVDEAISNYVSTHLALTDEGLFVLMDNTGTETDGYKLKLTSTGAYIIDQYGNEVAAYGTSSRIGVAGGRNVNVSSESVDVRNGNDILASFGETTVIGPENGAHIEIIGSRLSFKVDAQTEVAYVAINPETNESVFYMTKAIVVQDLFFGHWQWKSRDNDNLALKWVGNEVV